MSVSLSTPKFPSAIEGKLRSVRWRHATTIMIRAVASAWFVLIALMILSMTIDWLFPFMDTAFRLMFTSVTVAASVVTAFALGWHPVRKALGWDRAASSVDDEIPQLEQRWSTVVSLSKRDPSTLSAVEKAMVDQVTSEAIAMGRIVRPKQITPPASPRVPLVCAAAITLMLAGCFVVFPSQFSVLFQRFWSPTSNITATQLASVTGDQLVPRGEKIELVTELSGVERSSALLMVQHSDGTEQSHVLRATSEAPDQFAHTLRIDDSMMYRIRSGDAQTDWHKLTAIDYPEIDQIQFAVEFPEYTDRETVVRDRIPRRLKVVQGSTVDLAIKPLEPLDQLLVSLETTRAVDDRSSDDESAETEETIYELNIDADGWYRFRLQLLDDVILRPTLISKHGLENRQRLFSRIDVIADKPPVARVVNPTDEMAVAFDETLEIQFEAHDDHGIASAELVVYDESRTDADGKPMVLDVKEIPLGDQQMSRHVLASTTLDLAELDLNESSEISYAIRVTDNRDVQSRDEESDGSAMQVAERNTTEDPSTDPNAQNLAANESKQTSASTETADADAGPRGDDLARMLDFPPADDSDPSTTAEASSSSDPADAAETADNRNEENPKIASTDSNSENSNSDTESSSTASESNKIELMTDKEIAEMNALANAEPSANRSDDQPDPADVTSKPSEQSGEDQATNNTPADSETVASNATSNRQPNSQDPNSSNPSSAESNSEEANSNRDSTKDVAAADPTTDDETQEPKDPAGNAAVGDPKEQNEQSGSQSVASNRPSQNQNRTGPRSPNQMDQPPPAFSLRPQSMRTGQNTLTGRRRLKITERLAALADSDDRPGEKLEVRENVVAIDGMLAEIEIGLRQLVEHRIADSDRAEQFRRLDVGLGNVESYVANLREETRDNQYAFVGLQMVDIARTHVTPARDRVFSAIQRPNASDADATVSLQHVVRARELLAALLKRYDRVEQERKLKKALDESVTMYEVYLEKRRMLLREAQQNLNPLQRKMAVIEVDQDYLDRLAEVMKLRREMMDEFAQMLGDDPRLLSRYLELVKRRGKSLRDRLTEISQRQYEVSEEALGWLQIDDTQKPDLWAIYIELRLQYATDLAKDAAQLAERIEKQLPLEINAKVGTAAELIQQAREFSSQARQVSFDAEEWLQPSGDAAEHKELIDRSTSLVNRVRRLSATLDQLLFEHEGSEAVAEYVEPRILEARAVADQVDAWSVLCADMATQNFPGIVATEQHRLAFETQILRVEMLEMKNELDTQFQQVAESSLPTEIASMIEQLHTLMESITFNQVAATFRARKVGLEPATIQQQMATERLELAEALFDRIRRAVVNELDQYDVDDPNIADLRDPTLDEFLARLEREPSITAQLGIPNRRRNLRVIADSVFWQQGSRGFLGDSGAAAAQRAKEAMKMSRQQSERKKQEPKELTEEERQRQQEAKAAQEALEKSLMEIEKRRDDPDTPESQRQQLRKMAEEMKQLLEESKNGDLDRAAWERVVQTDEAKAMVAALARGESIPDQQWNKLISTLEDGLWQVRGKQPPEAYRKAIEQYEDQIRELMQTIDEG